MTTTQTRPSGCDPIRYWNSRAPTWSQIQGSPLVPNADEEARFRSAAPKAGNLLVLGATPALFTCAPGLPVTCVDFAEQIIDLSRRGDVTYHIASWLNLPLASASQSYVVGCGSLVCLRWPDEHWQVFSELGRVTARGGRLALRIYDPDVIAQLGHVPKFSQMLVLRDGNHNVAISRIDRPEYALAEGVVYSFPPLDEIVSLAESFGFHPVDRPWFTPGMNFPIATFVKL